MRVIYEKKPDDFYCRDSRKRGLTLGYTAHLHPQIELAFVTAGKTRAWIDNRFYELCAGDVIVVFPNQVHRFETVEREQYILLKFNPDMIAKSSPSLTSAVPSSNLLCGAANDPELRSLIENISATYYGDEDYKDMVLHGYLLSFFGRLLRRIELTDVPPCDYHILGTILNYCISNSEKDLSLAMLERELHISKYYISHMMSAKLHIGFNEYVNSLRVSNACRHLRKSDRSITEISELVGFNTPRTFNRAFYKQMGMTPREYRLQNAATQ